MIHVRRYYSIRLRPKITCLHKAANQLAYRLIYSPASIGFLEAINAALSIAATSDDRHATQVRAPFAGSAGSRDLEGRARHDAVRQRRHARCQRDRGLHRVERIDVDSALPPGDASSSSATRATSTACRRRSATGKVLSAVYRAGEFQKSTGTPEGYGLRLLVEPVMLATRQPRTPSRPPRKIQISDRIHDLKWPLESQRPFPLSTGLPAHVRRLRISARQHLRNRRDDHVVRRRARRDDRASARRPRWRRSDSRCPFPLMSGAEP